MQISQVIEKLEAIKATHGEIELTLFTDVDYGDLDGSFIPVEDIEVQVVGQAKDEESDPEDTNIAVLKFRDTHTMGRM